jgi:hypothetical protein
MTEQNTSTQDVQDLANVDLAEYSDLFADLGLTELDDEKKRGILGDIFELLELRIQEAIYEALSEDQRTELNKIAEETPEAVNSYVEKAIPHIQDIVAEVSGTLREELIGQAETLAAAILAEDEATANAVQPTPAA